MEKIMVWDWPQRAGHWLLALAVAVAWATSERDSLQLIHIAAGGAAGGIAAFRLFWGLAGSRHARFTSFLRPPAAVFRYLHSLLSPHPEHHTGHNPAGGWAVVALLLLVLGSMLSGWAHHHELGGHWLEELHEMLAESLLALVGLHVIAVIASSLRHQENLLGAMLHGQKRGRSDEAIASTRPWALLLLVACALAAAAWALS